MRKELITLTKQEHERLKIIRRVMKRDLRLKGRALKINEAQARTDRPRTGGFGGGRDRRY